MSTFEPTRRGHAVLLFAVGFVLIVAAWLMGVAARVAQQPAVPTLPPADVAPPAQFGLYGEAWDYVNQEFYGDRPAPAQITDGAIEGMVEALDDPWALVVTGSNDGAAAMPPSLSADDPVAPQLIAPLGLWIADTSRGARVLAVVPDGPAAKADLQADDLIVRAQNHNADAATPTPSPTAAATEAAPALGGRNPVTSGDRPTPVAVQLADDSQPTVEVIVSRSDKTIFASSLTRARATAMAPAAATFADGVLTLRIAHMGAGVSAALDAAIAAAIAGATPKSVVLDLRDDPGGSRSELASIAGRFMTGPVWIKRTRTASDAAQSAEPPSGGAPLFGLPLVILVNGGTGDEAEMLASALREVAGATLVGETTFGHGTLQSLTDVGRVQLRMTTGTWTSPKGVALTDAGLKPDEVVEGRQAQDDAAAKLVGQDASASAAGSGG
ncbi:MAG: S41 family peptidase [Ardenticatenales bacterium]